MSPTGNALAFEKSLVAKGYQPYDEPIDREIWEGCECDECARPVLWRGYRRNESFRAFIYCSAGDVQEV